jgi:hypothetical protein
MTNESNAREAAIKRIHQKKAFQSMIASFVIINVFLWTIWAVSDTNKSGFPWPAWVTLGWGVGVAITAWNTYGRKPITEADVQRELAKSNDIVDGGSD